jgi:hypothetical protein
LENKSSNEFNFLKGISLFKTLRKNICLNLFYSSRSLDAKLSDDRTFVNSFSTSGLHRTENERNKIGKWDTDILGIVVNNTFSIINTQLSFIKTDQGLPFRNIDQDQYHLSFSYSGKMKSLLPGGEIALFQNKYPAIQQTLNFTHENTNYDIIIYYYHPQYFALFGKSFASMSEIPQNKIGIAFLLNHRFTKGTKIGAYAHFYRDAHNGEELPFFNRNYFLEISQKIQNRQIKIQFKQKYRKNRTLIISDRNKMIQTLRLSYFLNLSQRFLIQNRAEFSRANPLDKLNRYYGVLIYHQLNWQINRSWRILTRWTTFDIPDYDLRLYETEPDLPGIFRTTLLYNRGYKMIFLVRWLPVKNIQFDLKYQQRFYPDLKKIGSGWDEFNSNRIHEIKLSFILRYN